MTAPIRWPAEAVWEAVAPLLPGFTVEVLPSIDSTNTELMRRARAGQTEPTLLVAEQQTAGRGRLGRVWQSDVGASLMLSLGLPMAPRDWSGLSLAVGVSVAESLQPVLPPLGANQPARVGLKWPNDLWLHRAKLAGILVETAQGARSGECPYVVVGVGINVAAPSGPLTHAAAPAPGGLLLGHQQRGLALAVARAAHEFGVGGVDGGQHLHSEARQQRGHRLPDGLGGPADRGCGAHWLRPRGLAFREALAAFLALAEDGLDGGSGTGGAQPRLGASSVPRQLGLPHQQGYSALSLGV